MLGCLENHYFMSLDSCLNIKNNDLLEHDSESCANPAIAFLTRKLQPITQFLKHEPFFSPQ